MAETGISWKPSRIEGEKTAKRWYDGDEDVSNDQERWSSVFEAYKNASPSDKKRILGEYDVALQTLQRKAGYQPSARGSSGNSGKASPRAMVARSREDVVNGLREHIETLEEDLRKSRARLERLEGMDAEEYEEMKQLMFG